MAVDYDRVSVSPGVNTATRINQELTKIEEALKDSVSRSGGSPNQMESDLDMGLHSIYNVKSIDVDKVFLGGEELLPGSALSGDVIQGIHDALEALQEDIDNLEIGVEIDLSGIENKLDVVVGLLEGSATVNGQILAAIGEVKTAVEDIDYSNELDEIIDLLSQLVVNPPAPDEGKEYYVNAILGDTDENEEDGVLHTYVGYDLNIADSGMILGTNLPGEVGTLMSFASFRIDTQEYELGYIALGFFLPEGFVLDSPVVTVPALGIEETDNVVATYGEYEGRSFCSLEIHTPGKPTLPANEPVRIEIKTRG